MVVKLVVTPELVIDAYIITLDNHLYDHHERGLRLLTDEDIKEIMYLKIELGKRWGVEKELRKSDPKRPKVNYHDWRHDELDKMALKDTWAVETRNLYASILSVLGNWVSKGKRSLATLQRLEELRPGAELFLQFLKKYQPKLQLQQKGKQNVKN